MPDRKAIMLTEIEPGDISPGMPGMQFKVVVPIERIETVRDEVIAEYPPHQFHSPSHASTRSTATSCMSPSPERVMSLINGEL
jgi:hypothetical protein